MLSDVDSEGNHRLQVLDTHNIVWSELSGLEGVKNTVCAGVGEEHLWVGTLPWSVSGQLYKLEVKM